MTTGYYISKKDYDKIIHYAQASYDISKSEIGGMSICYQDEDGDWVVTDPVILKQKVTGGTCDLDKDALADYYCKAQKKHGKKEFRFCWWHSHHTMGVFWSSTDIKGINEYSDGDMSFALVVNLKRENKFRISMWKPVTMHLDTELQIMEQKGNGVPKKITDEVEKLCETNAWSTKDNYPQSGFMKRYSDLSQEQLFDIDQYGKTDLGYSTGYSGIRHINTYGNYAESKINSGKDTMIGKEYEHCYGFLVDIVDSICNEGLEYEAYAKVVRKFNDDLTKMAPGWKVETIQKNDFKPELEYEDVDTYISYKGRTMDEIYYSGITY